jgi:hypothetical protein
MTVRSEERSIYTPSENPTVQIYVGSPDADPGTSDVSKKKLFPKGQKSTGESQCRNSRQTSGLPTVGTPDDRRDFRRAQLIKQPALLRPGLPAWDRSVSELPANVGTSDGRNSRRTSGLPTCTDSEQSEAQVPGPLA